MADRSTLGACKKFSANVFDKNKCQNCFKPKETHQESSSPTSPQRPSTLEVTSGRQKTTVKAGNLALATQISTLPEIRVQKWERFWFVLYSSGDLEWFNNDTVKLSQSPLGTINLDDCSGLTNAEVDTNEAFSIGIKTSLKVHYLKAENRLEMDNWCRVLKPFVIASPGYNFNRKAPNTHSFSHQETKTNSSKNSKNLETKPGLSRTVSAPWQTLSDNKRNQGSGSQASPDSACKKRWSATEAIFLKEEEPIENTRLDEKNQLEKEDVESLKKQEVSPSEMIPTPQPYYSDKYLRPATPEPPETKIVDSEPRSDPKRLEEELAEAKKIAKHSQGRAEICSKNLTDTKKCLEKANNVISIQKANIDSLTTEVENLRARLKNSDERMEKRLMELEHGFSSCNGTARPGSIEAGFIQIQAKLQENEKALIRRTMELEKANESRAKVAKHTRSLLLELEGKLNENNRRVNELEDQLVNRTVELQCEKEERERVETEKGQLMKQIAKENSKQRDITKRSTELLMQARDEHLHLTKERKSQLRHQEELDRFRSELQQKNLEVERLRERLKGIETKDSEMQQLKAANSKSNEHLVRLKSELKLVSEDLAKERTKFSAMESRVEEILREVREKGKELQESQVEKEKLRNETETVKKQYDHQLFVLQGENKTTKSKLRELEVELESLQTETDGRNISEIEELRDSLEEWKSKLQSSEQECGKLRNLLEEAVKNFNNEKNKRLRLERDLENALNDLDAAKKSQEEFVVKEEKLRTVEEKLKVEMVRGNELEKLSRSSDEVTLKTKNELAEKIRNLEANIEKSEAEQTELKRELCESEAKVISLAQELQDRLRIEQEAYGWIEGVEKNLLETQKNLDDSKVGILSKAEQLDQEKANILETVKKMGGYLKSLESSLKSEKSKVSALEERLNEKEKVGRAKCESCDKIRLDNSRLTQELDQSRQSHREELEKIRETMVSESQAAKTHNEEQRLKLTSKVILLQSEIAELTAKHEKELSQAGELERQELQGLREKCNALESSGEESACLREKLVQLESELQREREENERKIASLHGEYEAKKNEESQENGVVSQEKLEEVNEQHTKEIEALKENHRKELEENKSDMMMVLQALKSDSYQSSTMSNDSMEVSDELKNMERYVETLKKDHEKEIDRLNEEHEQDLQQLRSDMVTLLRVQETYKSPTENGSDSNTVDLQIKLDAMRQSHKAEMQEKDKRHREEVEQLKSDMLVAIQAASAVGGSLPQEILSPKATSANDARVHELEQQIAGMEKEFAEERESLQNAVKKAESATKFGLRRNEEMSNKIYQMQREMEEIDSKYQKEVKLYKEAFDQEKNRKTTIGAVPGILAENESLKVKLQELELSMEQMQVRYDGEIKRYKEKFQQENVLTVEELQLKIKSLEDTIAQMKLEHDNELERYTKAVKRGKVSLTGTAKERELERKIDDLESKVEVMRQKHREEVRKYRERLEDEMERHRKEVSESKAKLRKLEMDNRQMEDLRNKVTDLENKTGKLSKEANKFKEQELELTETKSKNRELQRQVDNLRRKLEKLEEASAESKERESGTASEVITSSRNRLSQYNSVDNLSAPTRKKSPTGNGTSENSDSQEDVFELNNNSSKEIGGYRLNSAKRPASVSAFPLQSDIGARRSNFGEKRRDSGNSLNRNYQSSYLKSSSSSSSLK